MLMVSVGVFHKIHLDGATLPLARLWCRTQFRTGSTRVVVRAQVALNLTNHPESFFGDGYE